MPLKFAGFLFAVTLSALAADAPSYDYRVLATTRTSTMEKEMNEAARAGYSFAAVMGGETSVGGNEAVVVMVKDLSAETESNKRYRLLATLRTSTMQKELQQAGDEGYEYRGQTVFETSFGGHEVVVILERDLSAAPVRRLYRVQSTSRTSTMQKELRQAGESGFRLLGLTVSKTSFGGAEVLCILGKTAEE